MELSKHSCAISVIFRLFIEHTVDAYGKDYIEEYEKTCKQLNMNLHDKFKFVVTDYCGRIKRSPPNSLSKYLGDKDSIMCLPNFNEHIHNFDFTSIHLNLPKTWSDLLAIMTKLWDRDNKPLKGNSLKEKV